MVSNMLSSFPRSTWVGFDRLFDDIVKHANTTDNGFPRHNVIRTSEDEFRIELAVAGFSEDDLKIELKDGFLTVTGEKRQEDHDYIHRGISSKGFTRHFRLADHTVVDGADLINGILSVFLRIEVPEEKKPRQIDINTKRETPRELLNG